MSATGIPDTSPVFDVEAVNAKRNRQLYAARKKIFPKRVKGEFRTLKWWVMIITLGIYYITPWIRWDRGPFAPDQAVLVDLANRRFYFFFIEIWPHEFFYVAGLLIMAGLGLFLITSVIGRAWCGYTCPQTVWVDLFLKVERWIEGDRNARMKLDTAPLSWDKARKRLAKHSLWLVIAVATGGAWVFYFADAPTLAQQLITFDAPVVAYSTIAILTFTTYVFGGHMREQVCTYMCPWPRIQSSMVDENTLTVTYQDWRGEPRGRHTKREDADTLGDCIDCNACVAVCPMGIDIRDGVQLECITCSLCIDACNGVMDKVGKPRGLISYATLNDLEANRRGEARKTTWRSLVRPRTVVYFLLWGSIGVAMLYGLATREHIGVNVLQDRNPVYVQLSDGAVRNGYRLKLINKVLEPRLFTVTLDGLPGAALTTPASQEPVQTLQFQVAPDQVREIKLFVRADPTGLSERRTQFRFLVTDETDQAQAEYTARFEAPVRP